LPDATAHDLRTGRPPRLLADAEATPDLWKLMAARVELRSDTVMRALAASANEPVALLCRAAGIRFARSPKPPEPPPAAFRR